MKSQNKINKKKYQTVGGRNLSKSKRDKSGERSLISGATLEASREAIERLVESKIQHMVQSEAQLNLLKQNSFESFEYPNLEDRLN